MREWATRMEPFAPILDSTVWKGLREQAPDGNDLGTGEAVEGIGEDREPLAGQCLSQGNDPI